jgi:hypothetical protein
MGEKLTVVSKEIEERIKEIENSVSSLVPRDDPKQEGLCYNDAIDAINKLREEGLIVKTGIVHRIDGPLTITRMGNHPKTVRHHQVGVIDGVFVVDIHCKPGNRVFLGLDKYLEKNINLSLIDSDPSSMR